MKQCPLGRAAQCDGICPDHGTCRAAVAWSEPPPKRHERAGGRPVARPEFWAALQEHPGKWAMYAQGVSRQLVGDLRKAHPGHEFTTRKSDSGFAIYVRWIEDRS